MHSSPPPTDKSLSNIFDLALDSQRSPSPPLPSTPAPAYTALPYRDVEFHLAPVVNGKVGEVEMETTDGKRFLVHKRLLEQETVFFHIYYGFVPVWRLTSEGAQIPVPVHQCAPSHSQTHAHAANADTNATGNGNGPLNNLLSIPKMLASHIARAATAPPPAPAPAHSPANANDDVPPPLPPKDHVTAPTPTSSPYTWVVPESSAVLTAFLSLIYPRGTFTHHPEELLTTLELTGRVVRAALGYQSAKALSLARDRLMAFVPSQPVEVYAMATFFKFTDLARLASAPALGVAPSDWPTEAKVLMGRTGSSKLLELRQSRLESLKLILQTPMEIDDHSQQCVRRGMIEHLWNGKVNNLLGDLTADSDLLELLQVEVRGGHCGDCLLVLGRTIQRCMLEAKELPKTV